MTKKEELKFFDPQIEVKEKAVAQRLQYIPKTNIPLPSEVEISESGMCNRKCSFCPRSAPDYDHKNEFISFELHKKLCDELKDVKYSGLIIYSGFVEPLLDKNIFNLISYAKKMLPYTNIEMVTNGDVLNEKRLLKLYDSGLSKLLISVYDGPEDVIKFQNLFDKLNISQDRYFIRHRYLPEEEGFGITLSNRAGMMEKAEYSIKKTEKTLKKPCYYPSYTFFLDYNGDVLMCPHDWGKKLVLGNLKYSNFLEIWTSKISSMTRKGLIDSDRNFSPCNKCDVEGTLIGKKHAMYWKNQ